MREQTTEGAPRTCGSGCTSPSEGSAPPAFEPWGRGKIIYHEGGAWKSIVQGYLTGRCGRDAATTFARIRCTRQEEHLTGIAILRYIVLVFSSINTVYDDTQTILNMLITVGIDNVPLASLHQPNPTSQPPKAKLSYYSSTIFV